VSRINSIVRMSGERGNIGEFCVEDDNGTEWQVTAVPSKKVQGGIAFLNEVVSLNTMYEPSWELRQDLQDAVRNFIQQGDGL
jgi:hypothetical protein